MLNVVTISGRLVRDPELRHTNSGKSVCSFTLAVDRDFKNTNGEKEVDYIDCVAWGNTEVITSSVYFGDSKRETPSKERQKNFDQLAADVGAFAEIDPVDNGTLPF